MPQALGGLKVRVPIEYDEVAACSRGKQSNAFKMQPPLLKGNRHMELHSAAQFGKQRDFWWHRDFLDLMALRWKLADASSIADIGCGLGHWSRLLYRYLKAPASLVGVDRESEWVGQAFTFFKRVYPEVSADQVKFIQGDALCLPLPSDEFDVVTCQTLLMHLKRPEIAIEEMRRITKPGGLVICVEPNNLFNTVAFNSLTETQTVEEVTRKFEYWLRFQRGKQALGEGNNSIGDLVPGLLAGAGLTDIEVYESDRAAPYIPPYDTEEQRVLLNQEQDWRDAGTGTWSYEHARRYVLAGGGSEAFFESCWRQLRESFKVERAAIGRNEFHLAGGGISYLVSGRKPM